MTNRKTDNIPLLVVRDLLNLKCVKCFILRLSVVLRRFNLHLIGLDPDERGGIQFAADAPVDARALEAVRSKTLLRFRVALRARVLFADPLLLLLIPDADGAVRVVSAMAAHPVFSANRFIKDVHVAARVLIEEQLRALFRDLCNADVNLVSVQRAEYKLFVLAHLITTLLPRLR